MSAVIRKAQPGDEAVLAHIQTESWKAAFADILDAETLARLTIPEKAARMYEGILRENKGYGYILEDGGVPRGIFWWDRTREPDMPGYAELICIHSLPGTWRRGYGRMMMERAFSDISGAGYDRVMLWVFELNHRACGFYEALGFIPNGRQKDFHGRKEICYEKALSGKAGADSPRS